MNDTKTIPSRFVKAYTSFLATTGYREPDLVEVVYDQVGFNAVFEWYGLSAVTLRPLLRFFKLKQVNDVTIMPALNEDDTYSHSRIRVFVNLEVPEIEEADLNTQIKTIRKWIKSHAPNLRVVRKRGTAYGWIGIWSSKEGEMFTDQELEALKKLGLRPGGNYTNISPDRRQHWYTVALDQLSMVGVDEK